MERPKGDITTVLDLTSRDAQDDMLYPLSSDITLFTMDRSGKKPLRITPSLHEVGPRGPTAFGQKCVFPLQPLQLPDIINRIYIQIDLDHWFSNTVRMNILSGVYSFPSDPDTLWEYVNGLGISIIQEASFEIGDTTIERITGEYIATWLATYPTLAAQIAVSSGIGYSPVRRAAIFPVENGKLMCPLPFFFMREKRSAFPLISCKMEDVRIKVTFRPFDQLVQQYRGYRAACNATPLGTTQDFDISGGTITVTVANGIPQFKSCTLLVEGHYMESVQREKYIKYPHEVIYKQLYINSFSEPLRYATATTGTRYHDTIQFLLPLEMNGPVEELLWVLRRKAAAVNNEWIRFGPATTFDYLTYGCSVPDNFDDPVVEARIILNGIEAMKRTGYEIRCLEDGATKITADNWIYRYNWCNPAIKEGHMNASRIQSIQLALTLRNTLPILQNGLDGFDELNGWEIYVFSAGMNWLRFENTVVGRVFS
jgi:hypothetical protein